MITCAEGSNSISQERLEEVLLKRLDENFVLHNHELVDIDSDKTQGVIKCNLSGRIKIIKAKFIAAADGGKSVLAVSSTRSSSLTSCAPLHIDFLSLFP